MNWLSYCVERVKNLKRIVQILFVENQAIICTSDFILRWPPQISANLLGSSFFILFFFISKFERLLQISHYFCEQEVHNYFYSSSYN